MDAKVRSRAERVRQFVAGRRERALWVLDPPPPAKGQVPADLDQPVGRIIADGDLQLKRQLWENERRLAMPAEEDYVPVLQPYLGTGVLASAFGAATYFADDRDPWTRPFIARPEEALALGAPKADAGLLEGVLRRTRRMREVAGPDYPIAMTDIQSPLDTAMLLWDQADLFTSMVLAPKAVHHVCRLVTDLTIEFVGRQREAAGGAFSPLHWPRFGWPDGAGVGVSDDVLPLIGPKQYEEFGLPYLARLSEAFGGIMVHSCGRFTQNLAVLARLPGLRMLNFGATEQPAAEAARGLPPEVIICPHLGLNKDIHLDTPEAFVDHCFDVVDDVRRLWLMVWGAPDAASWQALAARIAARAAGQHV
jgi:hypothetical protein